MLSSATPLGAEDTGLDLTDAAVALFRAFAAELTAEVPTDDVERARHLRITGALAALGVLALAANRTGETATWRADIVATAFDALGHARPVGPGSDPEES